MPGPHRKDRRRWIAAAAAVVFAGMAAACDFEGVSGQGNGIDAGVFYGLGDDHRLYRWDPDAEGESLAPVLDLSGIWERQGDVGIVMRASLSVDPLQRHAAWIEGASTGAALKFGDLETGEITTAVEYPVDHVCIDPAWLGDGSALLVHRAAVWGDADTPVGSAELPLPVESWGATEWYSPDSGKLPTTVEMANRGCRVRWYTAEDGTAQAIYHNLEVTELYRMDASGKVLETIPTPSLQGTEPLTIGLVGIDPAGRYACLVDDYGPYGALKGDFTMRAESGTRVVDLQNGEAVGAEDDGCVSVHADGYLSRDGASLDFTGYDGDRRWSTKLPETIAESPVLFFIPNES
ncbi:hypothetical protein [Glycomyces harbinensis]|uniref:Uncharacterized protein n=1 Tax=Glycomyces harbinensis TaxID=58114 RepID=A0A1G6Y384_9ACTN|nr:hypothetical protein [Glycomyces harbinensis]SDD84085.1 hypothetical protein SAMN05216270_10873 [Glycomyces harbinensis]